jgi:hypothetical protein
LFGRSKPEMEVTTGGGQHGVDGIAGIVCKIIAAHAARALLPNKLHSHVVRWLIPVARSDDVFYIYYRLNSLGDISRWFSNWENVSLLVNTMPRYFSNSRLLFRMIDFFQKLAPYRVSTDLFVFLKRRWDRARELASAYAALRSRIWW